LAIRKKRSDEETLEFNAGGRAVMVVVLRGIRGLKHGYQVGEWL
jgi:hypothetical protein